MLDTERTILLDRCFLLFVESQAIEVVDPVSSRVFALFRPCPTRNMKLVGTDEVEQSEHQAKKQESEKKRRSRLSIFRMLDYLHGNRNLSLLRCEPVRRERKEIRRHKQEVQLRGHLCRRTAASYNRSN